VEKVLSLDQTIEKGTDHYVDDIWIDQDVVEVDKVKAHLGQYGLRTKDPEPLANVRVLGLRVSKGESGRLDWKRDGQVPVLGEKVTIRELFSWCGKLVGHFPVVGQFRTACSYIRQLTNACEWDEKVSPHTEKIARETEKEAMYSDPVSGVWSV
jgi:hypothetical protein